MFYKKKDDLKNSAKIHWKTPVLGSLFNKFAGVRPATSLKIDTDTGVFL